MSTVVSEIVAGILGEISTELGIEYSELPYMNDVSMNNFNENHNRYGVTAGASSETDTVTRVITVNQSFDVVLTKAFVDDGISDDDSREQWILLQGLMLDIYKRLIQTKAGVPASIIDVRDLTWEEPLYLTEEKVVVLNASFNIRYRFNI